MRQTTTVPGMEARHMLAVLAGAGLLWLAIGLASEVAAAAALLAGGTLFLWGISRNA